MGKKQIIADENSPMHSLLEADESIQNLPNLGEIISGKIITANKKEVLLDINGTTTGIIRGKELYNESEEFAGLKPGDEAEATVMELENEQGMMELSFRYAGHQKTWSTLLGYQEKGENVKVKINDANKGGLLVTINGVQGFLPVSQLSPEYYPRVQGGDKNKILEKLKSYVGQEFTVKLLDVNEENEKLIVSEKTAWEETQKDTLNKYKTGEIVEGKITAVTDFGVFVEFGENLEGLVHISELAWQRIDNPSELYEVGQAIKAEIIKIEGSKIFLSSKKLQKDPWDNINEKYSIGDIVEGEIIKATPFGLFVKLDNDIHGLAHISELSDKKIDSVESFGQPGTMKKFKIVSIEPKEHRLGLSAKDLDGTKQESKENKDEAKSKTEEVKKEEKEAKADPSTPEATKDKEEPKDEEKKAE